MSLITCLSWVPKGFAKANPQPEKITAEDLAEIKAGENIDLDMENYDNEEAIPEFANVEYEPQLEALDDKSEEEDNIIQPTDALIVTGVQNGDFSEIHVYVYIQESNSLYVHHDIILPAYPLSLQWLPFNPNVGNAPGNCLAVGSFLPEIEIWDLDVLEVLEPASRLGGVKRIESKSGKKRKKTKTYRKGSHHDAVISLDLHPLRPNILASGSADKKIKVWDLLEKKCKLTLDYQEDKIQSVKWNPSEENILASGGLQGNIHIRAVDNPKTGIQTSVPSPIESLQWNPFSHNEFGLCTEDGYFYSFDARNIGKPVFEGKIHSGAANLSYSPGIKGLLATAGKDKMVKIWDASTMQMVAERDAKVDELFCLEFYKDLPFVLATGGMGGELAIWDTEENENVRSKWAS